MGERRWIPSNSWGVHAAGAWPHTDAEVLAEMGGKREWRCVGKTGPCDPHDLPAYDAAWAADHEGCGWVWVVKEATDE